MDVNKIKITKTNTEKVIPITISENWDFENREDLLNEYSLDVLYELAGSPIDYEIARFSNSPVLTNNGVINTKVTHKFLFYNYDTNQWLPSYINDRYFTLDEVKGNNRSLTNSFFKLDMYDSTNQSKRKNFLTLVLQQNQNTTTYNYNGTDYTIKTPIYDLDYNTSKENFFIYWFKDKTILNLSSLYMTAKFFDAKTGQFVTFTTKDLSQPKIPNDLQYFKVNFNYSNYTYYYTSTNSTSQENTMVWYEYINPQS
jgi:hypothetical protein